MACRAAGVGIFKKKAEGKAPSCFVGILRLIPLSRGDYIRETGLQLRERDGLTYGKYTIDGNRLFWMLIASYLIEETIHSMVLPTFFFFCILHFEFLKMIVASLLDRQAIEVILN